MLESLDGGKPIRESRDVDLPLAAAHFFYYAGWADKLEYAFPNRKPKPLGVAGQIIPWNFPLLMLAWKIAPALAAGNTVVLKPAETTPLTALLFADVCRQAELPPGVVNIVTGDGSTGAALVTHPDVDKIAFTGSTEVGKAIQRELAGTGKKLTLELGGKAANIIFDDAALDGAVEGIVNGIYFNQGHVCCAGSRLLVQESIYEQTIAKLKRRLLTLRLGDPLDKNTDIGAINSKMQLEKITELVESGKQEGAEIYQPPCRLPEKGYWFAPTVFTNVAQSYRIAQEEIFGPVLSVLTFRTPEEAVEKANNTALRALGRGLDGEGLADPLDGAAAARRRRLGEHVQPLRPGVAVRRLQGVGVRPRGRPPRARAVPGVRMSRLPVRKTYKLFIGGEFPRSESGRTYEAQGQNVARASRKDARDAVKAARGAQVGLGRRDRLQPRPGALPPRGDDGDSRRRPRRGLLRQEGGRGRRRSRRLVRGLGGQAGAGARLLEPRRRALLQLHGARADGRRRHPGAGGAGARRARLADRAGARRRQRRRRPRVGVACRWRRSSLPRRSRPQTCPAASSTCSPGSRDEVAPILAGHMDVNALDVTGADGLTPELERLAADNVKRVVHGTAGRAEPVDDLALPRAEDGLAPGRPVAVVAGGSAVGRVDRRSQLAVPRRGGVRIDRDGTAT